MTDIVDLAEAKAFIRVISDDEDDTIALLIASATESVLDLADTWDRTGAPPARLKLAVLTRVAIAFDNRESVKAGDGESALLTPLRTLDV